MTLMNRQKQFGFLSGLLSRVCVSVQFLVTFLFLILVFKLSTTVLYILLIIVLPGAGCSQGSGPV